MLHFEHNGQRHRIVWRHTEDCLQVDDFILNMAEAMSVAVRKEKGIPLRFHRFINGEDYVHYIAFTECRILRWDTPDEGDEKAEGWVEVANGFAFCRSDEKQFSKRAGRKHSLTKALRGFPTSVRKDVWHAYQAIWPHVDPDKKGLAKRNAELKAQLAMAEETIEALLFRDRQLKSEVKSVQRVPD